MIASQPRLPSAPTAGISARWARLVLVALVLAVAAPASAEGPDRRTPAGDGAAADPDLARAQQHFDRGQKLFALLRFADALVEYQAAFAAKPLPAFLFNIGQCHRNLGHYHEAVFTFRRYLTLQPDADNREQVEDLIAELEREEQDAGAARPPPPAGKPVYRRWWFWTGIVAVAAGTTAILLTRSDSGLPGTDLGNLDFPR